MWPRLRLECEVQSGAGGTTQAFSSAAKRGGKDNISNPLSTAQTNYDSLAGPAATLLLVSDCCLCSAAPSRETTEFTTGVNDALCNINFLLQFPADLPYYVCVATCFMRLFSGSFLHTSQPLAIWIIYKTEQRAVTVEISASFALLSFLFYMEICLSILAMLNDNFKVFPL